MLVAEFLELKCTDMMNSLSTASKTILKTSLEYVIKTDKDNDTIELSLKNYMEMRNLSDIKESKKELSLALKELYTKCEIRIRGKETSASIHMYQSVQSFDNCVWLSFSPIFILFVKCCIQNPTKKHNKILEDILPHD